MTSSNTHAFNRHWKHDTTRHQITKPTLQGLIELQPQNPSVGSSIQNYGAQKLHIIVPAISEKWNRFPTSHESKSKISEDHVFFANAFCTIFSKITFSNFYKRRKMEKISERKPNWTNSNTNLTRRYEKSNSFRTGSHTHHSNCINAFYSSTVF